MDDNDLKICEFNKKIATRFLKDLGLFLAWKKYLNTDSFTRDRWRNYRFADSIFGNTNFTSFLNINYGIRLKTSVSDIFRYYISINHIDCKIKCPNTFIDDEYARGSVIIDPLTKKMSLRKIKK